MSPTFSDSMATGPFGPSSNVPPAKQVTVILVVVSGALAVPAPLASVSAA